MAASASTISRLVVDTVAPAPPSEICTRRPPSATSPDRAVCRVRVRRRAEPCTINCSWGSAVLSCTKVILPVADVWPSGIVNDANRTSAADANPVRPPNAYGFMRGVTLHPPGPTGMSAVAVTVIAVPSWTAYRLLRGPGGAVVDNVTFDTWSSLLTVTRAVDPELCRS